jgi:hypothetical protein
MLTESRKFGLKLVMAHHHMWQFDKAQTGAISGVGTNIVFQCHKDDAEYLIKGLRGLVRVDDVVGLKQREAIIHCGDDIVRFRTLKRQDHPEESFREKILAHSHQLYCKPVAEVRQTVANLARGQHAAAVTGVRLSQQATEGEGGEREYEQF